MTPVKFHRSNTKTLLKVLTTMLAGWIFLAVSPWVPTASATTVTPCSDDEVTVMIEGYPLACSPAGGTGWQTLINAGFSVEGTQKSPEFICRINNYPDASVDKCLVESPSHAYWSYWHASLDDNSWVYSDLGALLHYPQPGTVEAWTWGPGVEPGAVPVSRTETEEDPASDSFFDSDVDSSPEEGRTRLDIPTIPTIPPLNNRNTTTPPTTTQQEEPEPEDNPDNPNEVLVFLDAEGNKISRKEYEELIAAASRAAAQPAQNRAAPAPDTANSPGAPPTQPTTTTDTPDPKSTRVMAAPALDSSPEVQAEPAIAQYASTAAQAAGNSSPAWMIALTVAFIILLGGAAAATWVIRRGEVNG